MTRVLAIRPEPGLSATLDLGAELGLDVHGAPLFEIRALSWDAPDPADIDGLLIGSANALVHGGAQLEAFKGKPVHAVGSTTAQTAQKAGFKVEHVGSGGLQSVLDAMTGAARLLRVSGAEHVPLKPPADITIDSVIAYESAPLPLPKIAVQMFRQPLIVLLHSAAAARHFAGECARLEIDTGNIQLAALGPRIVEHMLGDWRSIHISPHPRDADLLEMVRDLCL